MSFLLLPRHRPTAMALSFALIVLWMWCMQYYPLWRERGGDWMTVAIGAELVKDGHAQALYARTPGRLMVDDPHWVSEAEKRGYEWKLYPFIYPPLVAYTATPLAGLSDALVKPLVMQAVVALLVVTIVLACWQWHPDALRPLPVSLILIGLTASRAFSAAITSLNIHPLIIVLTIAAMIAAQRNAPRLAGSALAIAAFIKMVPAVLLLYWIAQRRWSCAFWCVAVMCGLFGLSLWVAGWQLHVDYLGSIADLSSNIVPIYSNKGIPTLLYSIGAGELEPATILSLVPLAQWIRFATALTVLAALAAVLARAQRHREDKPADAAGMAATLLIGTIATPAAWSHYFTFLVPSFLIWAALRPSFLTLLATASAVVGLCSMRMSKLGYELHEGGLPGWIVGGELAAALLLIVALLVTRERQLRPVHFNAPAGLGQPVPSFRAVMRVGG